MKMLAAVITLVLLSPTLLHAQGPERFPSPLADAVFTGWPVEGHAHSTSITPLATRGDTATAGARPRYVGTVAATTFGVVLGGALGTGAGFLLGREADVPASGLIMAGMAGGGAAYGAYTGARQGNHGRGDAGYTALGAGVGTLAGALIGYFVGNAQDNHLISVAVAVPIAVAVPATAELVTTR
jgi:MFS family permease